MTGKKVLIVDDEFSIRDMLRMALEIAEFECIEAENIQDAHRLIVDERPAIVLLDWMLPGGSGLELLRRLKRNDATAEIPVIMLTAKAAEDNVIQGLDVGADDYVTKPFAPRELIARIKAQLRRVAGGSNESVLRSKTSCWIWTADGFSSRAHRLRWAPLNSTYFSSSCRIQSALTRGTSFLTMCGVPTSMSRSERLMYTSGASEKP